MKILFLLFAALLVAALVLDTWRQWRGQRRNNASQCALCAAPVHWNNVEEMTLAGTGSAKKVKVCQRCHARHYKLRWTAVALVTLAFAGVAYILTWTPA